MATKVGELFVDLVIDAATGNLSVRQLVGALGDLDVASGATVLGLSKIAETFLGLAKSATDTAVSLTALQDVTGADPKLVQQWDKAATSIVGHAGTIVKAITAVNDINKGLATGKGAPAELNYLLGLSAYKKDAQGREVVKDAMDLMREMAAPGSRYRGLSRPVQEGALTAVFGGAGDDVFRLLKAMTEGKFHPERFDAMNEQTVRDLNQVRMDELKITNQLTGLFERLLVGGGAFEKVLAAISEKLEGIDKWLGSKQGSQTMDILGREVSSTIRHKGNLFAMGKDAGQFLAEQFGFGPAPLPRGLTPQLTAGPMGGSLDIRLLQDNKVVDTKKMRLQADEHARERMDVAVTWGNP